MKTNVTQILIVEDSEPDTLLLLAELERHGHIPEHQRVETKEAFEAALTKFVPIYI